MAESGGSAVVTVLLTAETRPTGLLEIPECVDMTEALPAAYTTLLVVGTCPKNTLLILMLSTSM